MKDITNKEFFERLQDVGFSGSKLEMLNTICIMLDDQCEASIKRAEEQTEEQTKAIYTRYADTCKKRSTRLYLYLKDKGLYDED